MKLSIFLLGAVGALLVSGCRNKADEGILGTEAMLRDAALAMNTEGASATLDDFHDAAAKADFARYFGHMTPEAVFLGTDATERWDRKAFEAYCRPYFDKGKGWTYRPHHRSIVFGTPASRTAWFDELLDNDNYGTCRGSGVLVQGDDGVWRIAQYNLSMPVPNDLARDVVRMIRGMPKK